MDMICFVQGADRWQPALLPECLDDYVAEHIASYLKDLDPAYRHEGMVWRHSR